MIICYCRLLQAICNKMLCEDKMRSTLPKYGRLVIDICGLQSVRVVHETNSALHISEQVCGNVLSSYRNVPTKIASRADKLQKSAPFMCCMISHASSWNLYIKEGGTSVQE